MGWRAAFIVVIAALAPAPAAYGAVFTVTGSGEGGTCSGTTCPSLRAAIAAAEATKSEPDTINVPEGVININNDLVVQSEMSIVGADARRTIVEGGAKYRLRTTASGILTLSRFTIRNGAAGGGDITDGGGIYNAGRLNLQDVRVTGSTAVRGGGIANNLGIVVADNLLVDNNVATGAGGGGGILNVAGQEFPELKGWLIVTDTTIFKNTATGTGGIGGVFSTGTGASVSLNRSTIADNVGSATRGTGGIFPSGNTQATGSIVARNLAGTATVNCSETLSSGLFSVEDDTDCGLAPGNLKPQLATALSNQGGQVDVLTIPTASDAFNRMPFGDTPCESTDARGLSRPQGTACDAGAFEIDQPATVTITEGPTGTITSTSTQFNFQANEPDVTVECDLTGPGQTAGFEPCYKSNAQPYSGLADGPYTFSVRAVSASFPNPTPTTRSFVVNAAGAPNTTITGGPTGLTNTATPTFTFASTEQGSTFQCRVDTAAFAACTSPHTTAALGQGAHTFQVRAIDAAGAVDATPAGQTFTVDSVAPDTFIGSGPTGTVASTSATFTFTSNEPGTTFQCALDSGAFAACPVSYTGLAQGAHTFSVRATDTAGNVDPSPATRTWTVDTTPPPIPSITWDTNARDNTPSFSFTSAGAATYQCRVDGVAFAACTSPHTTAQLGDGAHRFEVRATDGVGNQSAAGALDFSLDTVPPTAPVINSPTQGQWLTASTATVSGTAEPGSTVALVEGQSARGTTTTTAGGAWTITVLTVTDGTHTYAATARDAAGNVSPATLRAFSVDTVAPAVPAFTTATANGSTVTLAGATEQSATVLIFDGAAQVGTTTASGTGWTHAMTGVPDGSHRYTVRARDAAGNTSGASAVRTVVVDTGPPPPPEVTGPDGPTNDSTPTFTFAGETTDFVCTLDGVPFDCVSPFTPQALADGPHVFTVKVFDAAGNESAVTSRSFTVDTAQPAPPEVSGPTGATTDPNPAFAFTAAESAVECRLDGPGGPGSFGACASPKTFNALPPGAYVFFVRTTDAAGNQSTTQRAFTVTQVQQATPTPTPTVRPAQTPQPTPVPNQTIVVAPKPGGTVLVKPKGEKAFAPLDVTKGIPNGSEVDVRKGRVTLTSIPRPGAAPESADFYGGIFIVTQRGGITDLKLSEPLTGCPAGQRASLAARKTKSRKLWGNGKGSFRTSGKYSAATVRGTIWLVQDTCTTTLTRVTQGTVQVQDFVKKTKVLVKKGKPYTARAKRR